MSIQARGFAPSGMSLTLAPALLMSLMAASAFAGVSCPRPEAACVAYDLHVQTLIEDHGLVEQVEPEVLRNAAFTMLEAQTACRTGDVKRALALYDSIPLDHVRMTPFYRILMR